MASPGTTLACAVPKRSDHEAKGVVIGEGRSLRPRLFSLGRRGSALRPTLSSVGRALGIAQGRDLLTGPHRSKRQAQGSLAAARKAGA